MVIITIAYVLINLFLYYFNYSLIHSVFSKGPSNLFDPKSYLRINLLVGFVVGILGGTTLVIVNGRYFRKRSFKYALIATATAYIIIFGIANFISIVFALSGEKELNEMTAGWLFQEWLQGENVILPNFILWGFITLFTLFLLQVNDKFGPGVLFKFIRGNYHSPKKEERIFMFMDMKSSTTIAENIGNEKYFNLLNDVFSDLTNTILHNDGEIYQYVGDEIVICWPIKKGIRDANFIQCFLEIQKKLKSLSSTYMNKYGVSPEFRAGIHHGTVMAGEVGVIKKDIIYSGDVLNTTSRIQEQCKHFSVDLLISKETFDLLPSKNAFELEMIGNLELRGKQTKIEIGSIKEIKT